MTHVYLSEASVLPNTDIEVVCNRFYRLPHQSDVSVVRLTRLFSNLDVVLFDVSY